MIDWNKPIQTRDGGKVNIYTTKGMNERFPVVGEVMTKLGYPEARIWASSGKCQLAEFEHDDDIINVPDRVKVTGFLAIWEDGSCEVVKEGGNVMTKSGTIIAMAAVEELLPDGIEVGRGL